MPKLKSLGSALEEATAVDLDEEIDRTALLNEIRVSLRRLEKLKPQAKNPEFWLSHLLGGLHHLLLSADRTPAEKAAGAIGRLEDIPNFLADLKAALEEPARVFVETAMRMTEGGRLLVKELAAALGVQAPTHAARLAAAAERASQALLEFDADLARWHESGTASIRWALHSFWCCWGARSSHGLTGRCTCSPSWLSRRFNTMAG